MHIRRHPPEKGIPSVFVMTVAWFALVTIFGVAIHFCRDNEDTAHARDVFPPPIIDVRGLRPTTKPPTALEPIPHAFPGDGPMCQAPLPEEAPAPSLLTSLLEEPATEAERAIVMRAEQCFHGSAGFDPFLVLALTRYEVDLGVPAEFRGALAAAWCYESALRTQGRDGGPLRGDWHNGVARAFGPYQLWPWQRAWCGFRDGDADSLLTAAGCYWARVVDRREVRALKWGCEHSWRVGEALAANGVRYLPWGCSAKSGHWAEWERWQKAAP